MIPLPSRPPQPTTKKTPAKSASGIRCSTVNSGPVMVPMMAKPITKCDMRCSATLSAMIFCERISDPSSVLVTSSSLL